MNSPFQILYGAYGQHIAKENDADLAKTAKEYASFEDVDLLIRNFLCFKVPVVEGPDLPDPAPVLEGPDVSNSKTVT